MHNLDVLSFGACEKLNDNIMYSCIFIDDRTPARALSRPANHNVGCCRHRRRHRWRIICSCCNCSCGRHIARPRPVAIDRALQRQPLLPRRQDNAAPSVDDDGREPSRDGLLSGRAYRRGGQAWQTVGRRRIIIFLWRCGGELFDRRPDTVIATFLVHCAEVVLLHSVSLTWSERRFWCV